MTFDRGHLSGYIDGVKTTLSTDRFSTAPADPLPADDGGGLSIGGVMPGNTDPSCTCRLDDVRLYRRTLAPDEILQLAQ